MDRIILHASELDGYLQDEDKKNLLALDALYAKALAIFPQYQAESENGHRGGVGNTLISLYDEMGTLMQEICSKTSKVHVYSFLSPQEDKSEASRVIARIRDVRTANSEFIYYIQRSFEMLYKLAYAQTDSSKKNYLIVKTPVTVPVQNFAVHKISNADDKIKNTVMCVMLRGALLPSMILSKEIEEYSSFGYVTPFALFSIKRNDNKKENNMEYILDLDRSYFSLPALDGKDLIFADPMNATGGSLVTVVNYLMSKGVKPKSIKFFNVISALKGSLRAVRALDTCEVYTLWMDPVLNENAYIMPGLGDAGDRINGKDIENNPRSIFQLIASYGATIANLYRAQLREIENTVMGKN